MKILIVGDEGDSEEEKSDIEGGMATIDTIMGERIIIGKDGIEIEVGRRDIEKKIEMIGIEAEIEKKDTEIGAEEKEIEAENMKEGKEAVEIEIDDIRTMIETKYRILFFDGLNF